MASDVLNAVSLAAANESSQSNSKSKVSNLGVDSDMFLKLLVAQFQYQNPLEPQTDTQFVSQLAQMTTLEEMRDMSGSMAASQAYGLVGKYAHAQTIDTAAGSRTEHFGIIHSILYKNGAYYALIGEKAVDIGDIRQIMDPDMLDNDTSIADAANLIGKIVTGTYEDEEGQTRTITGRVEGISSENGRLSVKIGDVLLPLDAIVNVSQTAAGDERTGEAEEDPNGTE